MAHQASMESRAWEHLQRCIPSVCQAMPEEDLRRAIRWGLRRARNYGFSADFDQLRYLNLMFVFGFEFDVNPLYPWAGKTLANRDLVPRARMDLLMDRAMLFASKSGTAKTA